MPKCSKNTLVITNTHPLPPFTVSIGQGVYPPLKEVLGKVQAKTKKVIALDGDGLAQVARGEWLAIPFQLFLLVGFGLVVGYSVFGGRNAPVD